LSFYDGFKAAPARFDDAKFIADRTSGFPLDTVAGSVNEGSVREPTFISA